MDLLKGAVPRSAHTVSETGLSNRDIFKRYLKKHILKFIKRGNATYDKILLLFDGHMSHVSLDIIRWDSENDIMMMVLPPLRSRATTSGPS